MVAVVQLRHGAVRCGAVRYDALLCGAVQCRITNGRKKPERREEEEEGVSRGRGATIPKKPPLPWHSEAKSKPVDEKEPEALKTNENARSQENKRKQVATPESRDQYCGAFNSRAARAGGGGGGS